jgi:hypothetical protein
VPILQARCASCHGRRGGLTLTPAEVAYAGLVDVPSSGDASLMRVKPGAPLQSLLFLTLTDDAASAVGAMPPRQALSLAEPAAAELIRQWIAEGALKN